MPIFLNERVDTQSAGHVTMRTRGLARLIITHVIPYSAKFSRRIIFAFFAD